MGKQQILIKVGYNLGMFVRDFEWFFFIKIKYVRAELFCKEGVGLVKWHR